MYRYTLFIVVLLFARPGLSNEAELLEQLRLINADPAKKQQAIEAGKNRAYLCKYCHGDDGNSVKNTIPNLASQNPEYLLEQFELFRKRKRISKTMNEIVKTLSPEDRVNLSVFYSSQTVKPQIHYKPELQAQGKTIFEERCFSCHGNDGHGNQGMPRIASQPSEYIIRTLSSYRSALVKRAETPMSQVARKLDRDEIEAVTAYLTSLM